MTDIFLSYSSVDRDRVRPLHDALSRRGFEVFWDQTVPVGTDWDTWIRERLRDARVAMVVWSRESVKSKNVRHEAAIAEEQGKLVSVVLDPLSAQQLPLGQFTVQAANLSRWMGTDDDEELVKLSRSLEAKLTPIWLAGVLDGKDHVIADERARRATLEGQVRALRDQITREGSARTQLQDEIERIGADLNDALTETADKAKLRAENDKLRSVATESAARIAAFEQELASERSAEPRSTFASTWATRILIASVCAFLVGVAVLYVNALGTRDQAVAERDAHAARLADQLRDLQAKLDGALEENRDLRRQLDYARSPVAAPSPATPTPSKRDPPPEVCPEAGSDFSTGPSTFTVNKAFSRSCVEKVARTVHRSQPVVARLLKPGQGTVGTAQFVAYVLSINGVAVNPNACNTQCFTKQLRQTTTPQPGDVVVFLNESLGLYASDGGVFVLRTGTGDNYYTFGEYSYVSHEALPPAQVKAFLSVTGK